MATNRAAFSHLLAPGLRKVFFDEYKDFPEEYSQLAEVLTSQRAYEEELMTAGLGLHQPKPEANSIVYDDPIQGDRVRYTHGSWGLGFRVTREMYDDDLYGVMKKMSKELARSARLTVEMEFGAMLDDVFDGNVYTGHDGAALCDTHTLLTGATYTNQPTVPTDLTIGALRSASERLERTLSERGLPDTRGRGSQVVVSPTYQWVADEILNSSGKAYTADNTKNTFGGMGISIFVSHYQSDDDQWLLTAEKGRHDLKFFWRVRPKFENEDDFDTKDAKFSSYMRFSMGFTDWRGIDGSSSA